MQVLGMVVPGLNSGKFFSAFFVYLIYPVVTTLLEYLFTLVWFLLYNFVAVTLSLFDYDYDYEY